MATLTHDEARAALVGVINTALAELDDPLELIVRDPRYLDVDRGDDFVRSQVVLVDGKVAEQAFLQGVPPSWDLEAIFVVGIEGLGGEDAARQSGVSAVRQVVSQAIADDFRLGGAVTYAQVRDFDPEDIKTPGVEISTLNSLTVAVQFVSATQTG